MRRRLPILILLFAALVLTVAACGSDDDDGGDNGGGTTSEAQQGGGGGGGGVAVDMKNIEYVPKSVTVKAGEPVNWTNGDSVAHTVTSDSGTEFDSGTMEPGAKFSYTPKSAGTINYFCEIHPNQKGTVVVQ